MAARLHRSVDRSATSPVVLRLATDLRLESGSNASYAKPWLRSSQRRNISKCDGSFTYAVHFHITERLTEARGLRMLMSFDSVTDGRYSPAKPMINYMQMSIGNADIRCAKKSPITFRKSLFSICIILSLESTSWFTSPASLIDIQTPNTSFHTGQFVFFITTINYSSIIPSSFHSRQRLICSTNLLQYMQTFPSTKLIPGTLILLFGLALLIGFYAFASD